MSDKNCKENSEIERFIRLQSDAQRRMFSFIQTLVYDWSNAEEILQETNVTIWRKREQFNLDTDFMHWANRIAYYECLKFRSKNKREHNQVFSDDSIQRMASKMLEMEDSLQHQSKVLESCLKKLPEKDRKLIQQRYFEGSSVRAIAETLGRSARTIYCSLQRIRNSLRSCILRTIATEGQE